MTTTPPVTPPAGADDPKAVAYAALEAALKTSDAAANNPANTKAARDVAFNASTALSEQLDALDQAVFTGNTVDLQASAKAMDEGMKELKALKEQIEAISKDLKEAATIVSYLDQAIGKLSALGM
jgi:hypothetical protein